MYFKLPNFDLVKADTGRHWHPIHIDNVSLNLHCWAVHQGQGSTLCAPLVMAKSAESTSVHYALPPPAKAASCLHSRLHWLSYSRLWFWWHSRTSTLGARNAAVGQFCQINNCLFTLTLSPAYRWVRVRSVFIGRTQWQSESFILQNISQLTTDKTYSESKWVLSYFDRFVPPSFLLFFAMASPAMRLPSKVKVCSRIKLAI